MNPAKHAHTPIPRPQARPLPAPAGQPRQQDCGGDSEVDRFRIYAEFIAIRLSRSRQPIQAKPVGGVTSSRRSHKQMRSARGSGGIAFLRSPRHSLVLSRAEKVPYAAIKYSLLHHIGFAPAGATKGLSDRPLESFGSNSFIHLYLNYTPNQKAETKNTRSILCLSFY